MKKLAIGAAIGMLIHETLGYLMMRRHPALWNEYCTAIDIETRRMRSRFGK